MNEKDSSDGDKIKFEVPSSKEEEEDYEMEESLKELEREILTRLEEIEEREILTKLEKSENDSINISPGDVMKKVGVLNNRCENLEKPSFKTKTWKVESGTHREIDLFCSILEIDEFNDFRKEGVLQEKIQKQEIYTAMAVVAMENKMDVVETILAFRAKRKDNIN